MRIGITGSTGLIGNAITEYLKEKGHEVVRIIRLNTPRPTSDSFVYWDIPTKKIDLPSLEGLDGMIHLAGVNIAEKKWNPQYKEEIYSSRINGTNWICDCIKNLSLKPRFLLSASAIGYYGNVDPQQSVEEGGTIGNDFLANVCDQWEKATKPAQDVGVRVVHMRFGAVLSPRGGALGKMLPIFKLGLGGPLGKGNQIMSWVALDDVPLIISHLIDKPDITGAVNIVAPNAVTNKDFTNTLGIVLERPAVIPVPEFGVKMLFGEMGETILLGGARVIPKRLQESNYQFRHPTLEGALRACLV